MIQLLKKCQAEHHKADGRGESKRGAAPMPASPSSKRGEKSWKSGIGVTSGCANRLTYGVDPHSSLSRHTSDPAGFLYRGARRRPRESIPPRRSDSVPAFFLL
jgi:hypothetical protein